MKFYCIYVKDSFFLIKLSYHYVFKLVSTQNWKMCNNPEFVILLIQNQGCVAYAEITAKKQGAWRIEWIKKNKFGNDLIKLLMLYAGIKIALTDDRCKFLCIFSNYRQV